MLENYQYLLSRFFPLALNFYYMCLIFTIETTLTTARGRAGRVMDSGVSGLGFKSPGSILTSRTETSSLSRVVRDSGDPCSVPLSGWKKVSSGLVFDKAVEQPQLLFRKLYQNKNKKTGHFYLKKLALQPCHKMIHSFLDAGSHPDTAFIYNESFFHIKF